MLKVIKRHYFDNDKTLDALGSSEFDLVLSANHARSYGSELGLKVSYPGDKISERELERANGIFARLRKEGVPVHVNDRSSTASRKYFDHMFEEDKDERGIRALCCLDQYPLHRGEFWEPIIDLTKKMEFEGSVYANGSRNVRVRLGVNDSASDMRIIHEMFHSLSSLDDAFKIKSTPKWTRPHLAYEKIGESTSGFYFINRDSIYFKFLDNEIRAHPEMIDVPGFQLEYLSAVLSSGLGVSKTIPSVAKGYVYSVMNEYYNQLPEAEEKEKVKKFIIGQTRHLSETRASQPLSYAIRTRYVLDRISEFFDKEQVNEVAGLMNQGLK